MELGLPIDSLLVRKTRAECLLPLYLHLSGVNRSLFLLPYPSLSLSVSHLHPVQSIFHSITDSGPDRLFAILMLTHPRSPSRAKCSLWPEMLLSRISNSGLSLFQSVFFFLFRSMSLQSPVPYHPGSPREALTQVWGGCRTFMEGGHGIALSLVSIKKQLL